MKVFSRVSLSPVSRFRDATPPPPHDRRRQPSHSGAAGVRVTTFPFSPARHKVQSIAMTPLNGIFEGLIDPGQGDFSAELAQYVLGLKFSDEQSARCEALSYKNQEGPLPPDERAELEAFVTANTFLMILQSKARRSLLRHSPAA